MSDEQPNLPVAPSGQGFEAALEERLRRDEGPPRSRARQAFALAPGCGSLLLGFLTTTVLIEGPSLAVRLNAIVFGIPITAGMAWLAWRWGRGLDPTPRLGDPDEGEPIRLDE